MGKDTGSSSPPLEQMFSSPYFNVLGGSDSSAGRFKLVGFLGWGWGGCLCGVKRGRIFPSDTCPPGPTCPSHLALLLSMLINVPLLHIMVPEDVCGVCVCVCVCVSVCVCLCVCVCVCVRLYVWATQSFCRQTYKQNKLRFVEKLFFKFRAVAQVNKT